MPSETPSNRQTNNQSDRLQKGFANVADHAEQREELAQAFLTWVRADARSQCESRGIPYDRVHAAVSHEFKTFIYDSYAHPVVAVLESGASQALLAKRYGRIHPVTVARWFDGSVPKLDSFAMICAADGAVFERGHTIAARAYVRGVSVLCREINSPHFAEHDLDDDLMASREAEEVLVLYMVFRCARWWRARDAFDLIALDEAANEIDGLVNQYIECRQQWTIAEIEKLMKRWEWEWSIVEAILPYDWF